MKIVFDIECDSLNPNKIWVVVCRDLENENQYIFRNLVDDISERVRFLEFSKGVKTWIGHNILGFDIPVLQRLTGLEIEIQFPKVIDTLVISRMLDYPRSSHSIEDYGIEFNIPKGKNISFSNYTKELEEYCIRDVDISIEVYNKYKRVLSNKAYLRSYEVEHLFQYYVVNKLTSNGFAFNEDKARRLLEKVERELAVLDRDIEQAYPSRTVVVREFTPKLTKYGTISLSSVPKVLRNNIHEYEAGKTYTQTKEVPFNPSSHKQLIEILWKQDGNQKTRRRRIKILRESSES